MSSRIAPRLFLALLLGIALQLTSGAPARAVAELRAMSCCAHDCGHAPAPGDASRCCGVAPSAADSAAVAPAAAGVPAPEPAVIATALDASAPGRLVVASSDTAAARAAPVFLLTRTLRL